MKKDMSVKTADFTAETKMTKSAGFEKTVIGGAALVGGVLESPVVEQTASIAMDALDGNVSKSAVVKKATGMALNSLEGSVLKNSAVKQTAEIVLDGLDGGISKSTVVNKAKGMALNSLESSVLKNPVAMQTAEIVLDSLDGGISKSTVVNKATSLAVDTLESKVVKNSAVKKTAGVVKNSVGVMQSFTSSKSKKSGKKSKKATSGKLEKMEESYIGSSFLSVDESESYEAQLLEQLQMIWFLQNYALMQQSGMMSELGSQNIDSVLDERIVVSPYPLVKVNEFHVTRGIGKHDTAVLKGIIDENTANMYRMMLDTTQKLSITFCEDDKETLLFNGFLDKLVIGTVGEFSQVELRLSGLTKSMDVRKGFRDFQSTSKNKSDIINTIINGYSNIKTINAYKDRGIEEFVLQYEESDYAFLKRILSKDREVIYTNYHGNKGSVVLGGIHSDQKESLINTDYTFSVSGKDTYTIKTEKVLDLCTQVEFLGKNLYVCETKYELVDGEMKFEYKLIGENGIHSIPLRNPRAVGISLDGSVIDTNRDKVQIQLNSTSGMDNDSARWFPYSSPAASSDGSGWYCMPPVGEEIRLYSPTDDEKDAYVISAIKSSDSNSESDPANKNLSGSGGEAVSFTDDGVVVACAGGAAIMNLAKTGELTIITESDLDFCSDNDINIRADQGITIMGTGTVTAGGEAGGKIVIDGSVAVSGNHIYNNSNY